MNATHEFAIRTRIIGSPTPTLRRKEITSSELRTVIWRRFRHRAESKAAIARATFPIAQPREIELGIVRGRIVCRRERNEGNADSSYEQCENGHLHFHTDPAHVRLIPAAAAGPGRIQM